MLHNRRYSNRYINTVSNEMAYSQTSPVCDRVLGEYSHLSGSRDGLSGISYWALGHPVSASKCVSVGITDISRITIARED